MFSVEEIVRVLGKQALEKLRANSFQLPIPPPANDIAHSFLDIPSTFGPSSRKCSIVMLSSDFIPNKPKDDRVNESLKFIEESSQGMIRFYSVESGAEGLEVAQTLGDDPVAVFAYNTRPEDLFTFVRGFPRLAWVHLGWAGVNGWLNEDIIQV